jgi:hypothetical protein
MGQILSDDTKKRLIRYATAKKQYEIESRAIYYRDGSHLSIAPSLPTLKEYFGSQSDLVNCAEPDIQQLVYQIQIERIDEAMSDETKTEVDVMAASHNAMLADNELVHLGHKYRAEQEAQIKPHCRRRDVARSRNRTRRRKRR